MPTPTSKQSPKPTCQCFEAREGTVRYADQSHCRVHRIPCGQCGGPDAEWRGDTMRVYCCDDCWSKRA